MHLPRHAVLLVAVTGVATQVAGQYTEGPESNDQKTSATIITGLVHGNTISGTSTGVGISLVGSQATRDYFLISPADLPDGRYIHRLVITTNPAPASPLPPRHTALIPSTVTGVAQQSQFSTNPNVRSSTLEWYGFGREEPIFVSVQGTTLTTSPYVLEFQTFGPLASPPSLGSFVPGALTISTQFAGNPDTEIWVFDSALQPMTDPVQGSFNNDDVQGTVPAPLNVAMARLTRVYSPGTYYLAIGRYNLSGSLASPPDERAASSNPRLDFPGAFVASSAVTNPPSILFSIQDAAGTIGPLAAPSSQFAVAWYEFEVGHGGGCIPVTIGAAPTSADVCEGNAALFQVEASGSEPITYQWRFNGFDIPGANGNSYAIPAAGFGHAGLYSVLASNPCGAEVAGPATLSVHEDGPQITDHPDPLTLCVGEIASFSVAASPHTGGQLLYQWRHDGVPIPWGLGPVLQFTVGSIADAGYFDCLVTEVGCGSSESIAALLTVRNDPPVITLNGPQVVEVECHHQTYVELGAFALDDCDPVVPVIIGGDAVNTEEPGSYVVTYNATDSQGNPAATAYRFVTVVDSDAPNVDVAVGTGVLWSPDHELINVGLTAQASDGCDESVSGATVQIRVLCDEVELPDTGDGTGKHAPDCKDAAPGTLRLRSERKGSGNGRVYLIIASAEDASGNVGFAFTTVVCPNGQNQAALDLVNAQAASAVAAASLEAAGTGRVQDVVDALAALGYIEHGTAPISGPHQ